MASEKENAGSRQVKPGREAAASRSVKKEIVVPMAKKRTMPGDYAISIGNAGGTDRQLLNPPSGLRHSMKGFEETYTDIVDYIVRITHRIWEEKDIGYIYDTYSHKSKVYDDFGLEYGREKIVQDTLQTINAFPDIRLYADEVIWAGDDVNGFYTSHRTIITGTNTGPSKYGPPTFKKFRVMCMANCVALENEIFNEHVCYDHCDLIRQLGLDPFEVARKLVMASPPPPALGNTGYGENERLPGQGKPGRRTLKKTGRFDVEDFIRYYYHYIWNWRNLSNVNRAYAENITFTGCNGRNFYGVGALQSYILSILAMFPDAQMIIDDVYWMGNDDDDYLVSVRWSLTGSHTGFGIYGDPTGRQVVFNGLSQHRIRDEKIMEEWTLFSELGVLMQLAATDHPPVETGSGS